MRFLDSRLQQFAAASLFAFCLLFSSLVSSANPVLLEDGQQEVILNVENMT